MENNLQEFRFNTGVKVYEHVPPVKCFGEYQIVDGIGVKIILFYCKDVPKNATFLYACDNDKLEENKKNVIVREIVKGGLNSKYAYFQIN